MEVCNQYQGAGLRSDQNSLTDCILSQTERRVAEEYCKGLSDKEVADNLCKSYWTIKTQKKTIYRKLGISKDTELLWWMICERLRINFDLNEIRKHGITLLMALLIAIMQISCRGGDLRRGRTCGRARTELRSRRDGH